MRDIAVVIVLFLVLGAVLYLDKKISENSR